jgi:Tfp pilus assembly protein PilF
MDRHNDAIVALKKAEKIGATDPWLQNNWADLLIDEGKYEEAAVRYHKVLESKTKNKKAMGSAFEGLTRYYRALGKLDQADEIYRKHIEYEPEAAWHYGNYGQFLLCDKDDYEQSIKQSRNALKIMDYGVGRYFLASALYRKWAQSVLSGAPDSGQQYFIEAQEIYPNVDEIAADTENCPSLKKIAEAFAQSSVVK